MTLGRGKARGLVGGVLAAATAWPLWAQAAAWPQLKVSTFGSLVGGQILGGRSLGYSDELQEELPRYIADWANWGTYPRSATLVPESRVGVQATLRLQENLAFSGQLVSRGTDPKPDLQWAYLAWGLGDDWEVQLGRKRVPLYYYSDFQDVGYAYPWISPPPELYGWEITNFNGGSLRYRALLGATTVSATVFAGQETVRDSRFMRSTGQRHTDVSWDRIRGAVLEASREALTVRGVYLRADSATRDKDDPANDWQERMKAYGLAVNLDLGSWFLLSEAGLNVRHGGGLYYDTYGYSLGLGHRRGRWTALVNYARLWGRTDDATYDPLSNGRPSVTLRCDLSNRLALKAQIDRYTEFNELTYVGNATVFRISLDWLF